MCARVCEVHSSQAGLLCDAAQRSHAVFFSYVETIVNKCERDDFTVAGKERMNL